MRIGLQTWGTEGDVRPFIALADGLVKAGHGVHLAVTAIDRRDYSRYAEQTGFQLTSVGVINHDWEYVRRAAQDIFQKRDQVNQFIAILNLCMKPFLDEMFDAAMSLVTACDLVIGHPMIFPLGAAAESLQSPYAHLAMVTALYPSRHITPLGAPNLGEFMNKVWWRIGEIQINYMFRSVVNEFRARHKLPPIRSVLREAWKSPHLNITAVSPSLCPRMPDWDDSVMICGFLTLPPRRGAWETPESLSRFLEMGTPPVFMSFGSMADFDPDIRSTVKLFIESAKLAGCRAIIQADWGKVGNIGNDPSIYRLSAAPHHEIFPRCAAVVHHGGAGTTQTATLAGVPSVIVAHCADQPFWGASLHRAGVSPPPLFRRNVTPRKLARAIMIAISSGEMAEAAKRTGAMMAEEKGVQNAVARIENFLSKS